MSIFINGTLLAEDQHQTKSLAGFPGAVFGMPGSSGSDNFAPNAYKCELRIAQLITYNQALNENQRKEIEDNLRREYNL
jgi:hypothetical protein